MASTPTKSIDDLLEKCPSCQGKGRKAPGPGPFNSIQIMAPDPQFDCDACEGTGSVLTAEGHLWGPMLISPPHQKVAVIAKLLQRSSH